MAIKNQEVHKIFCQSKVINWHYIEQRMSEICKAGFNEIRTPAFEDTKFFCVASVKLRM